ncbi:response regulator [Pseudomonas lopnurensis]|uniref:response regulator n=1 Tax=Pseudomonas lopnurensis TaxID=1477517 RepID=UPI00187B05CB|nr:response regulator transcription factor [Pseudomonas lopnurensis]MBE7375820.1 response regulator transcription factor [Pseudomonas lopnurensis]
MTLSPIRVLIVEDDEPMRAEFERMAREHPGLLLQGSAANLAQARALLQRQVPDVAIIDLGLPDGDGIELICELQRSVPLPSVLVATVFGDEAHVIRAIEAGARGYLLKDTAIEEFARAIRMVHQGGSPLSPQIARHLLKRFVTPTVRASDRSELDSLTAREIEILTSISQGFTVAETANSMSISAHTVTTHIKNIYSKLAVHNRVEAVNQARRKGLIH